MPKSKKVAKPDGTFPKLPVSGSSSESTPTKKPPASHAIRETVESIVIAFVLAFLFRTFEAEAFVIPTGSMAPTLMGRHKDVECSKCGHSFLITASEEESDQIQTLRAQLKSPGLRPHGRAQLIQSIRAHDSLGGMCPLCRHTMPVRSDLPPALLDQQAAEKPTSLPSYNGDRILVNKYIYGFHDPERWDIVVFKYPGNAQMNYIKRLVGLPAETLRIYQGDVFAGPLGSTNDEDFTILRKPPAKILAMRQLVHDTNFESIELFHAGWPLRWQTTSSPEESSSAWQIETRSKLGKTVWQRFVSPEPASGDENQTAWIRYQHTIPSAEDWQQVSEGKPSPRLDPKPHLIADFTDYNARVLRHTALRSGKLQPNLINRGIHWVGDLIVTTEVEVKASQGELLLDLVEAGQHFTCRFDLTSGRATLEIEGLDDFSPSADTPLGKPGEYRVALANVDDRLLLWVDDRLVSFSESTEYDGDRVFGDRRKMSPRTGPEDLGDLAPAGIGVRGADLAVTRLQIWRDIYYIADDWKRHRSPTLVTDYEEAFPPAVPDLFTNSARWDLFLSRRHHDFPLEEDQFFMMGDNSPESQDSRLWAGGNARSLGHPGGSYLERRLLIGKALCVYWPHSWNRIPGTPIPFPLFPNFADMRLVR